MCRSILQLLSLPIAAQSYAVPRLSNTNSILATIVDRIPPAKKGIAKNDKCTDWVSKILANDCRNARAMDFQNIIVRTDGEIEAS